MPMFREIEKDFFQKWSGEMAYILGFFAADGNIVRTKRNTHFMSFCSVDKDILEEIQKCMNSGHKLSERQTETGCVYRFQIGSKMMFEDLVRLGFEERKSNRMIMPRIPSQYVPDFVRGYFDGDGNVWVGTLNKNRQSPTLVIQAAFTSGSKVFLTGLLELLRENGIKGGSLYTSKTRNFSRLHLSTLDALKLSEIMYNGQPKLYLQRKKLRFDLFRSKRTALKSH